jgi:glycosyltransferase involved in cell wall biosynthesis
LPTAAGLTTTSVKPPCAALDYTPAYEQGGGIGRYVRELVAALACVDDRTRYRLFVAGVQSALPPAPGLNFAWRSTALSPRWLARIWHRARLPLPVEAFTGPLDLYHATDFVLPPHLPATRTLVTVHDLSFIQVPETANPRLKAYLDAVVPRSVHRADHVLADSAATRADLVHFYDLPPEKITVLLSGVDSRFRPADAAAAARVRQKYGLTGMDYLLSVGTVQPRKNYARLAQALALLRQQGYDLHLVIVGGAGWLEDPIHEAVRAAAVAPYVHFIGFADDVDLPALYSAAQCLVFPSLYEGFGLPVLEAMACGTPVVTSNVSSLPEVAGDAALLVDPYAIESIADAVARLLTDSALRQELIRRGTARAAGFTWEAAARQLVSVYAQLLAQGR